MAMVQWFLHNGFVLSVQEKLQEAKLDLMAQVSHIPNSTHPDVVSCARSFTRTAAAHTLGVLCSQREGMKQAESSTLTAPSLVSWFRQVLRHLWSLHCKNVF